MAARAGVGGLSAAAVGEQRGCRGWGGDWGAAAPPRGEGLHHGAEEKDGGWAGQVGKPRGPVQPRRVRR
eukprot:8930164-Alexandrium_andersonii.AAC.1